MRIAILGGSFDPVHQEHVRLVKTAMKELGLDRVIIMPSYLAPHKSEGAHVSGADRLEMCRIAFRDCASVEVSDFELLQRGTSYTYLTCRRFAEEYPDAERFFLVGADMLENFFTWRNPEDILKNVTLAACGRGSETVSRLHGKFIERFGKDFLEIPFVGEEVSSTELRVALAFRGWVKTELGCLDEKVFDYIDRKNLYSYLQAEALVLEKESRREHSYRVALLACIRARSLKIPEEKALLASMLHDCGKYISPESPLLEGAELPEGVPEPVLHQYVGALLAERKFGVTDQDVLNAIRYHTSGRANMSGLEKLVFLSDMLEAGRSYEGVERLRELFWKDIDLCLKEALREQIIYLRATGKPIFELTEEAYRWILEQ